MTLKGCLQGLVGEVGVEGEGVCKRRTRGGLEAFPGARIERGKTMKR